MKTVKQKLELKVSSYTTSLLFQNVENSKYITSQIQTASKKDTMLQLFEAMYVQKLSSLQKALWSNQVHMASDHHC